MGKQMSENVYLKIPIERVKTDAIHGVSLARLAWRQRDPDGAALVLGYIIEPGTEKQNRPRQGQEGKK